MMFFGMDLSCAFESLREGKIPDRDCLLPLMSKVLGYCIVAASTTVKLPQILKILKHKSVRGLSTLAFELEVVGYTIALSYCLHKGLPFSAYGELAFLLIQALILVAIIYYYSQPPVGTLTWIRALLYCAVAPTILAGNISPGLFEALYASQHAVFFCARVPQIWQNFKGAEQEYRRAELLDFSDEFCRLHGKSFHQLTGKGTVQCCYGLGDRYLHKWDNPESNSRVREPTRKERGEEEEEELAGMPDNKGSLSVITTFKALSSLHTFDCARIVGSGHNYD